MADRKIINSFRDEYFFLSNMYPCSVTFEGQTYPSSESAFQAAKCLDENDRRAFTNLNGYAAKKKGRRVSLRPDWESVKLDIMFAILQNKFEKPALQKMLLATGNAKLVEGNTWNDTFWGVDIASGSGLNNLGVLLMRVREKLAEKPAEAARIVVFGGSFNPMTKAHVALLETAIDQTNAELGIFVPSSNAYVSRKMSYQKAYAQVYSEEIRANILQTACDKSKKLRINTCEYGDDGRGHTFDTLSKIQDLYPDHKILFLIGSDKLSIIPKWRNSKTLLNQFEFVVAVRNSYTTVDAVKEYLQRHPVLSGYLDSFHIIEQDESTMDMSDVSSSKARRFIQRRQWKKLKDILDDDTIAILKQ